MAFASYILLSIFSLIFYVWFVFKGNISNPPAGTTDDDIIKLVKKGDELKALKWYRKIHKCSPIDARSAINKLKMQKTG